MWQSEQEASAEARHAGARPGSSDGAGRTLART